MSEELYALADEVRRVRDLFAIQEFPCPRLEVRLSPWWLPDVTSVYGLPVVRDVAVLPGKVVVWRVMMGETLDRVRS